MKETKVLRKVRDGSHEGDQIAGDKAGDCFIREGRKAGEKLKESQMKKKEEILEGYGPLGNDVENV
jgi:hypothetical protein